MFNYGDSCYNGYLTIGKSGEKHTRRIGLAIFNNYRRQLNDYDWVINNPRLAAYIIKWHIDRMEDHEIGVFRNSTICDIARIISCDFFDKVNVSVLDVLYRIYVTYYWKRFSNCEPLV